MVHRDHGVLEHERVEGIRGSAACNPSWNQNRASSKPRRASPKTTWRAYISSTPRSPEGSSPRTGWEARAAVCDDGHAPVASFRGLPLWDRLRSGATSTAPAGEGRGVTSPLPFCARDGPPPGGELLEREVHDRLGVPPCLGAHRGKDGRRGRRGLRVRELIPVPSPTPASCAGVIDRSGSAWLAGLLRHRRQPLDLLAGRGEGRRGLVRRRCAGRDRHRSRRTAVDATTVTAAVTLAARAATSPTSPSRWPRRIWTVAGMEAETLIVVLPSE